MRVLLLHNRYQIQGGEDVVVAQESAALRSAGVEVEVMEIDNDAISGIMAKLSTTLHVAYSSSMRDLVRARIRSCGADVVHVHNFFPRFTPSVYDAAADEGCCVVQTLHNYRLLCANGYLFRDERICMDCLNIKNSLPGIQHRCYRGSFVGTAALNGMVLFHKIRKTWVERVDRFIALTTFAREMFIPHLLLDPEKVVVKANLVPDIGLSNGRKDYALFVGRLSPEKGINMLLRAARTGRATLPIKIVGSGRMQDSVQREAESGTVDFVGKKSSAEVHELLRGARVLIVPSIWHEAGVPLVIGEAYSAGVPVICCNIEPIVSVVNHEENGLLISPNDENALADAITRVHVDNKLHEKMSRNARITYEQLYQPEPNIQQLLEVYSDAAEHRRRLMKM